MSGGARGMAAGSGRPQALSAVARAAGDPRPAPDLASRSGADPAAGDPPGGVIEPGAGCSAPASARADGAIAAVRGAAPSPPHTVSAAAPLQGRIRWLVAATSRPWLEQAIERPDLLLIDHAHCERKAAGAALQLMFRYPGEPGLAERLSPLAREELEHFELLLAVLARRNLALRPLPAPGYGAELSRAVRRDEPQRMLDSFLVAGLIEARSHERMALLAAHSPDPALRELYGELLASEARHFGLYWGLAEARFGRQGAVAALAELARLGGEALTGEPGPAEAVRMHSPGLESPAAAQIAPQTERWAGR